MLLIYDQFTTDQLLILKELGFIQTEGKSSGFLRRDKEDSNYGEYETISPTPFKVETYGTYPDGDGGYEEDYDKDYFDTFEKMIDYLK